MSKEHEENLGKFSPQKAFHLHKVERSGAICGLCNDFRRSHRTTIDEGETKYLIDDHIYMSEPKCAFDNEDELFYTENWQCQTMNELRQIAEDSWFVMRDDMSAGSIGVIRLPEECSVRGYLVMNWYKNRGRTDQAMICNEDGVTWLTLAVAKEIIGLLK